MCLCDSVLRAVERINAAIRKGVAGETVNELMNSDAQLPQVYPTAADLYQRELASLQQQSPEVRTHLHMNYHSEELALHVTLLYPESSNETLFTRSLHKLMSCNCTV